MLSIQSTQLFPQLDLSRSFQLFKIIEELRSCTHKSFTGDCVRACLQDPQLWGDMIDVLKEQMSEGAWQEVRDVVGIKAFKMIEDF